MLPAKAQSSLCIYPVSQEHSLLKENVLIVYALNYYLYVNALWCLITKYFVCANREGSVQTSQMCRLVLTSPWCPKQIQNLSLVLPAKAQTSLCIYPFLQEHSLLMRNVLIVYVSHDMRFPTMWYARPAKAQTSLRICAVWSEPLLLAWIFYEC